MTKPLIIQCHILDTGYCLASEHHLIEGGQRKQIACHSIVALFRHPTHGCLMWDAGYAMRMITATQPWPYLLYRLITPLRLSPELAVINQLSRWSISHHDIRRIVISHFHADHVAGLRDFPQSNFIATKLAYDDAAPRRGFNALRRALIPALLPDDFLERATLVTDFNDAPLPALGSTHDLFGDGSLSLVPLPGHACGQLGLLANTERGRILFAADGCWHSRSIRERRPPAAMTNLVAHDASAVLPTINRLADFAEACPDVRIVPSHCPEAFAREVSK